MACADLDKILQLTDNLCDKYGPVMMYQLFSTKYLVITDPTLADEVGEGPTLVPHRSGSLTCYYSASAVRPLAAGSGDPWQQPED